MRKTPRAVAGLVAVLALCALALGLLRSATVVSTQGISMAPRFSTGDLAVLLPADAYGVGDIVAYFSPLLDTVVMHRIVEERDGRFVLQGDNNGWLDPELVPSEAVLGALALRVPQGGVWLDRLTAPPVLTGAALLLFAGGSATQTRRRRRRRETMSRHARPTLRPPTLDAVPPALQTAAAVAAGLGIASLLVAGVSWTTPTSERTTEQRPSGRSMLFGYSAAVTPSAAYDGPVVGSPDIVFRKLAGEVDVRYAYTGGPATVGVQALLSTTSGWRTTVPLPVRTDGVSSGTVRLDLAALERRARDAAAATGLPAERVSVRVVAEVQAPGVPAFRPELALELSPLQLTLPGGAGSLQVADPARTTVVSESDRRLGLLGRSLPVSALRLLSLLVLVGCAVAGAVVLRFARRSGAASEAAGIAQRYAALLLEVQPMPTVAGRPVVEVTAFSALARLADRYGLLVLHWSRSGIATFVVQDDSTTFRYRTGASLEGLDEPEVAEVLLDAQPLAHLGATTLTEPISTPPTSDPPTPGRAAFTPRSSAPTPTAPAPATLAPATTVLPAARS